jgi:hypothetical protein
MNLQEVEYGRKQAFRVQFPPMVTTTLQAGDDRLEGDGKPRSSRISMSGCHDLRAISYEM